MDKQVEVPQPFYIYDSGGNRLLYVGERLVPVEGFSTAREARDFVFYGPWPFEENNPLEFCVIGPSADDITAVIYQYDFVELPSMDDLEQNYTAGGLVAPDGHPVSNWYDFKDDMWVFDATLDHVTKCQSDGESRRIGDMSRDDLIALLAGALESRDVFADALLRGFGRFEIGELQKLFEQGVGHAIGRAHRLVKYGPHVCPERMSQAGSQETFNRVDRWYLYGRDRVCSFCGSLHPDELPELIEMCLVGQDVRFDLADRKHKVYIRRPGVLNASEGAVAYCFHHGLSDGTADKLAVALEISRQELIEKMGGLTKAIEKE